MKKLLCLVLLPLAELVACRSNRPSQPPYSEAVFTADGESIAFTITNGNNCFLYTSELATGMTRRLTRAVSGCETDPAEHFLISPIEQPERPIRGLLPVVENSTHPSPTIYGATWLPDGKRILFEAGSEPPEGGNFNYNVYILSIASGSISKLSDLKGQIEGLSVSNDGKKAVLLQHGGYYILDINSHRLNLLAFHFVQ